MHKLDIYQQVTDKIISELEHGAAPWVCPWEGSLQMPVNASSERAYSGINILLLWIAANENGYNSQRWMTFKQVSEAGGHVRKGERSTKIIFVKPCTKTETDGAGNEVEKTFAIVKGYSVFNVEQCEGLPNTIAKTTPPQNPISLDKIRKEFVAAIGAEIRHGYSGAAYYPKDDFIGLPSLASFKSEDGYWSTTFHELTHWTGAERHLDRKLTTRFGTEAYAAEELVAELGAAFLCSQFGLQSELHHAGYIENWLKLLKKDKRAVVSAAALASKAVTYLNEWSAATEDRCKIAA